MWTIHLVCINVGKKKLKGADLNEERKHESKSSSDDSTTVCTSVFLDLEKVLETTTFSSQNEVRRSFQKRYFCTHLSM